MDISVNILLTLAGLQTGPFDLYSDLDGFTTPFETNVSKDALLAGYISNIVPLYTQILRCQSVNGDCPNYIDIPVSGAPIPPTPTGTPTVTPTNTVTPTVTPTNTVTPTHTPTPTPSGVPTIFTINVTISNGVSGNVAIWGTNSTFTYPVFTSGWINSSTTFTDIHSYFNESDQYFLRIGISGNTYTYIGKVTSGVFGTFQTNKGPSTQIAESAYHTLACCATYPISVVFGVTS